MILFAARVLLYNLRIVASPANFAFVKGAIFSAKFQGYTINFEYYHV